MRFSLPILPAPLIPIKTALMRLFDHDGFEIAGFIAYTALVSLFPFTIFLFALAGFLHQTDYATQAMESMFEIMPAEVVRTLSPILREILGAEQPGLLTLGIVGTLWATTSGVEALRMGLNRAYQTKEGRPFWKRKLASFAFVVLLAFGLLAASLLIVVTPALLHWVETRMTLPAAFVWGLNFVRYAVSALLLIGLMALLYRLLPAGKPRLREVWPGAVFASALWLLLASLFSLYLSHSSDYTVTYGSLGGVVITLLFLQFSALIFLLGAEFNAALTPKIVTES